MDLKKLRCLQVSDLNWDLLKVLTDKHRSIVYCITGNTGQYQYKKLLWETLWRVDLDILEDLKLFFALQELYEFSQLMHEAIKIKTLEFTERHLKLKSI